MIIDFHTHTFPDKIADAALTKLRAASHTLSFTNGTVSGLRESMESAGINWSVVLPVATNPLKVRSINDLSSALTDKDRLIYFGCVHPDMENAKEEIARIAELGLKGIKIHPDCQRFAIDDPRLFPAYEQIRGKLPLMLHMGDRRYDYSRPERLRRVLELFPGLQVIAAHFGGYAMYDTACDLLKDTDCVFDVSSSLMFLEEGKSEYYVNLYGAERLAFGSDYPMWDPVIELDRFLQLKLTPAQQEQILHKTAERVLHL
jgi:predicted TIM-barrel fold metal-dependent hydrolase